MAVIAAELDNRADPALGHEVIEKFCLRVYQGTI